MIMKIRLTKEFDFETAHALDGYEGKCQDIHGHSYHLRITVIGEPNQDEAISDCGMVVDFGDIKSVVREFVYEEFDHRLILRDNSRFKGIEKSNPRVRYVPYQPTCENMLVEIVDILNEKLTDKVKLHSAFLRETANSYAEWFADDNA
ncbi:MAG: 6-pyruvoyltetrahydropterin/6-carboxytetrahydropterin synthase [Flavobacteriales bacterium]